MVNFLKRNYELFFCFFLLGLILIISISPQRYIDSAFYGFEVWAKIVLPSLFVFFILTKLLQQNYKTQKVFNKVNLAFNKLYNVSGPSGYIFFMSIISGYPLGAKLISEFYLDKTISKDDAKTILSFASTSGPMFILGSVASVMLNNFKIGLIIIISHYLATLLNGFIYKKRHKAEKKDLTIKNNLLKNLKKESLNEIMLNTISSSLMVGGFIALSFSLLEFVSFVKIFYPIEFIFEKIKPNSLEIVSSVFKGIFELTNGCVSLINCANINAKLLCVLLTGLITFGGISIHLQSNIFLNKCGIKYSYFLKTKLSQTFLSIIISLLFSIILS